MVSLPPSAPGDLASLLARIEALSGPDREVDALIVAYLNNALLKPYPPTDDFGPKSKWQFWSLDGAHFLGNESKYPVAPVTASLDSALALVERVQPQAWVTLNGPRRYLNIPTPVPNYWRASIDTFPPETIGWGATPALAILSALIRSLQHAD